jgi:hypothetical protein
MQLGYPDAIWIPIAEHVCRFDRKPTFAGATRADDRNDSRGMQALPYSFERPRPANE